MRSKVEHPFLIVKRQFGYAKCRYRGIEKNGCALTVLFALFAYLVYLRMDGLGIPRVKHLRSKRSKDPMRNFGSMTDHVDDEPQVTFDDLETEEKDLCSLLANLICLIVFLAFSFLL